MVWESLLSWLGRRRSQVRCSCIASRSLLQQKIATRIWLALWKQKNLNVFSSLLDCLTLEDGNDRLPETSVTNYEYTLRNIPEDRRYKVLFCPMFPYFQKSIACWKVPRFRPFVLLVAVVLRWRRILSITEGDRSTWSWTCSSRTWTDPSWNEGRCGERPATNRLSHGMAQMKTELTLNHI